LFYNKVFKAEKSNIMTSDEIPESIKVQDQIPDCQNTLSKLFWSEHQNFLTF
jgi:hypothetical protein